MHVLSMCIVLMPLLCCADRLASAYLVSVGLTEQQWDSIEVLLCCGVLDKAGKGTDIQVQPVPCLITSCDSQFTPIHASVYRASSKSQPCCDMTWLQKIWGKLRSLQWLHSAQAGVESLLFPELIESSVVVTNAKVSQNLCSTNL